ncbi:hypothetical protein [Streptomyces sp.]|uniref:hypothetical protein n=1 Tax=Streptomyces sp. TaxID=1931 RepID=UPI0028128059|nr:hypothetical protein [Streptomyces sp.]
MREASALLLWQRPAVLVVVSEDGHPLAVVTAARILTAALPASVVEDPLLAAVGGGSLDDAIRARAASLRLADLLPERPLLPPVVSPDATPVHMAALMERTGSPEVLVVAYEDQPQVLGTVDAARLLHYYFPGRHELPA